MRQEGLKAWSEAKSGARPSQTRTRARPADLVDRSFEADGPGPALGRRHHLCSDLVVLRLRSVGDRCVLAVRCRLACLGFAAYRPGSRRPRRSTLGPPTRHSRPPPEAGASLRRRQPIPVHPLHQPAGGSRHLTVGRLGRRLLRQRPSRSPSSASTRPLIIEGPLGRGGSGSYKTWLCAFSSICRPVPSLGA